jgi:hypothetical protein
LMACDQAGSQRQAVCKEIGSYSEGWYDPTTGELIIWDFCAPMWDCLIDPGVGCL